MLLLEFSSGLTLTLFTGTFSVQAPNTPGLSNCLGLLRDDLFTRLSEPFSSISLFYTSSSNLFNQLQIDSHMLPCVYIPWCLQVSAQCLSYLETASQPHVLLFFIIYHIDQPLLSSLMFPERKILLSPCFYMGHTLCLEWLSQHE